MFHCAGSEPGTGSDHTDTAQYTMIASDKSALTSAFIVAVYPSIAAMNWLTTLTKPERPTSRD